MITSSTTEWIWLSDAETINLTELAHVSGLEENEINELVDYGALSPEEEANQKAAASQQQLFFSARWVVPLRKAAQIRRDYDLDLFVMVLLLDHITQIESLESQLRALKAHVG